MSAPHPTTMVTLTWQTWAVLVVVLALVLLDCSDRRLVTRGMIPAMPATAVEAAAR